MERKKLVLSAITRGMEEGGRTGDARPRMARGTAPNMLVAERADARGELAAVRIARGAASGEHEEPARSIHEALERLIAAEEADEVVAEWMQEGG